jgi:aryl-alcohol dehydrogenase-like predicted oxidoreductase
MQNHYNLLYREEEREMFGLCAAEGIGVIPWSPLARGLLTRPWQSSSKRAETDEVGKKLYTKTTDVDRAVIDRVGEVAELRAVSRAQVAMAWVLSKPVVTSPIIGATKPHHLEDAIAALSLKLSNDEIAKLEEAYVPHPIAGFE